MFSFFYNYITFLLIHISHLKKKLTGHISGDIALGREVNRPSRRIAEKSLTEIFPAEFCLRTAKLSNDRPLFSRIYILANVKMSNRRMFDSLFFRCNADSATLFHGTESQFTELIKV